MITRAAALVLVPVLWAECGSRELTRTQAARELLPDTTAMSLRIVTILAPTDNQRAVVYEAELRPGALPEMLETIGSSNTPLTGEDSAVLLSAFRDTAVFVRSDSEIGWSRTTEETPTSQWLNLYRALAATRVALIELEEEARRAAQRLAEFDEAQRERARKEAAAQRDRERPRAS